MPVPIARIRIVLATLLSRLHGGQNGPQNLGQYAVRSAMAYGRARDVFTRQTSCMEARTRWKEGAEEKTPRLLLFKNGSFHAAG